MEERKVPARFTPEELKGDRPEGRVHKARDERGHACRLVVSTGEAAASLMLRQAHTALMRLAHPHMAATLALEPMDDGRWLAASEWVEPVADVTPEALLSWLPGWLSALGHLHAAGYVHGDLAPETLGLAADGTPKLADAGRLWRIGQRGAADARAPFAAPEARSMARVDGRTDLYMLGALCHYWLTGAVPAPGEVLGDDAWPDALNLLVEGLMAPTPGRRFASAADAVAALGGQPVEAPARLATPFVGRRDELERLLAVADEVSDEHQFRAIVVSGEAGLGKTRLMEEFRQRLVVRGFAVAAASAGERTDGGAYAAWAPLLAHLAGRVDAGTLSELAPVLVALVPGLSTTPAPALEPRAARMRLFRAVASLIEAASEPDGLAVFIDDWHLADAASQELLAYLKRTLPAVPVCLVLGSQSAPPEGDDGLVLTRFGHQEVGALVRGVWGPTGGTGGDGGAGIDFESLDGHPALVEEAVLEAVGAAVGAGSRMGSGPRAQASVPTSFQALWTRRVAQCSGGARALASAAAVAGAQAPMALLQRVSGLEDATFLAALEELTTAGVLATDSQGFTLAAPANAVTDGADGAEQHAEALAYWRVAAQMGRAVPASLLAHHALAADDAQAGAYYALAAAKEAHKLFALVEAESLLQRGLACMERLSDVPAAWRLEYETVQGDHQRYMGRGVEAERHYREALNYAKSQPPHRVPELTVSLGIALGLQSRSADAEACFQSAIAHPALMGATRARAITALARLYVRLGRPDEAAELCREAMADADAPALYRGEALGLLGLVCVTAERPRAVEGLRHLDEARTLAEAAGDRLALNNVFMLAGNARMALGQLPEARLAFERYYLLCNELGLADELACATLNLAQVALEEGRLAEAWERATIGTLAAAETGNRIYEAYGKVFTGVAGCHLGRLTEAEAAFEAGLAIARELNNEHLALQVLLAHLEGAIFLGRLAKAEELGLEISRRQSEAGIHEFVGRHALLMGHLYEVAGQVEEAIGYFERARTLGEGTDSATLLAGAQLGRALVALRAGQLSVAYDRAQCAHDLAESAGAELARLQALLVLGRAAMALGRPEEARGHLIEADRLAGMLASPHWQAMVWQCLSKLGEEEASLRQKAGVFFQFYLQQLPPIARQEFLNWPDRRDAVDRILTRTPEFGGLEG